MEETLGITWDPPHFYQNEESFIPLVGSDPLGQQNTRLLTLDGSLHSSLDWQLAEAEAKDAIADGQKILWKLDCDLFTGLKAPLADAAQFMALRFSLDQFCTNFWPKWRDHSLGVVLYQGLGAWDRALPWDFQMQATYELWLERHRQTTSPLTRILFSRECASEFLNQLVSHLPMDLHPFLLLQFDGLQSPLTETLYSDPALFKRFHLGVQKSLFYPSEKGYAFLGGAILPATPITWRAYPQGFVLPEVVPAELYSSLNSAMERLLSQNLRLRPVAAERLVMEWEGLETLYLLHATLDFDLKRTLAGFTAAGGEVIFVDQALRNSS